MAHKQLQESKNFYLGLDIGATKVCAAICQLNPDHSIQLRGVGTSISYGLDKGYITDPKEVHKSIERAVSRAENEAGCKVSKVLVNVPALGLEFMHNTGMFISKDESGQITESDKVECIRRSKNVALSSDKIVLHAIPLLYKVEGDWVQNPVGVFGKMCELNTHIILSQVAVIDQLKLVLKECGFYINGIMYDALSQSHVFLSQQERKDGAILVDIGGASTKVSVFKNNVLCQSLVLHVGGDVFTSDIAKCLNVSIPEAERLKILYADIFVERISSQESIEITTKTEGVKQIKRFLLCQIVEARAKELFKYIEKKCPLIADRSYQMVVAGGSGLLKGMSDFLRQLYNEAVREGMTEEISSIVGGSSYSSAVGMVLYGVKAKAIDYVRERKPLKQRCVSWARNFF